MKYRKLDANNDYTFGNGQADFYNNVPDAVGQAALTGLLLWLGEWFLDTTLGMPWIEGVLGKNSQSVADGTIQNQILNNTQGVTGIESYSSTYDAQTNSLTNVNIKIDTEYGPTQVDMENYKLY